ncbi:MAG: FhaA domain-containing protein [Moorellales bacterium]
MTWLKQLEERLARWWEGAGRGRTGSEIQPVEIAKHLLREMNARKKISVRRVYVPNRYLVYLSPTEWTALSAVEQTLSEELGSYLEEKAAERGYTLAGRPQVYLEVDENLPPGRLRLHSRFSEEDRVTEVSPVEGERRLKVRVVQGPDAGLAASFGEEEILIGRRPGCHLVLSDPNVSRRHAAIERRQEVYWLIDLGSTNGTRVNGQQIQRQALRPGDRIRVGDSELEVEW